METKGKYEIEALEYIAKLADGGCRDAITMLDKCLAYSKDLTLDNVVKALGTTDNVAMRFVISYATRNEFVEKVREIQSLIKIEDVDGNNMLAPLFDPEMICE